MRENHSKAATVELETTGPTFQVEIHFRLSHPWPKPLIKFRCISAVILFKVLLKRADIIPLRGQCT